MNEKEKSAFADTREWVKELLDSVPDEKLMAVVQALEDVALRTEGEDPFYSTANQERLKRSILRMNAAHLVQ